MEVRCPQCEGAFTPSETDQTCPHCGAPHQDQQAGFSLLETLDPAAIPSGSYSSYEDTSSQQSTEEDDLIGLQLGNFILQEKVGEGGFGVVYLAEQVFLKQPFAIKILHLNKRAAPELIERFRREALAIARLRHPNAVQLSDFGLLPQERGFYLVMELLEGTSLLDAIANKEPFPPRRIASIVKQLCEVLYEAHELGIYHRDLKPGNVFLQPHRRGHDVVKLLDFGVATMLEENVTLTQTAAILGSPAYMSPEQSQGNAAQLDGRSDLYSLGVMLFELLTGRLPFEADTLTAMLFQHAFEAPPSLTAAAPKTSWSPQLEAFVSKALAKSPDDRPQDADAFALECQEALEAQRRYEEAPAQAATEEATTQPVFDDTATIPAPVSMAAMLQQNPSAAAPRRLWPVVTLVLLVPLIGGIAWWFTRPDNVQPPARRAAIASQRAVPARRAVDASQPPRPSVPAGTTAQGGSETVPNWKTTARRQAARGTSPSPRGKPRARRRRSRRLAKAKRRKSRTRRRRRSRRRAKRGVPSIPPHLQKYVSDLRSRDRSTRERAFRTICQRGEGIDVMLQLLQHGKGWQKRNAVMCLGIMRVHQAIPLMIQWLSLPRLDHQNIFQIQQAFQRFRGVGIRRLVQAYKRFPDPDVRRNVLRMMLSMSNYGLPYVIKLFQGMPDIHKIDALGYFVRRKRKSAEVRQILVGLVHYPNPAVRLKLTSTLGNVPCCGKELFPALLKLMDDRDQQVRYGAMRWIYNYRNSPHIKQAIGILIRNLKRGPKNNRKLAIDKLSTLGRNNPRVLNALGSLFTSSYSCYVQRTAAFRLGSIGRSNPAATPLLQKASQASSCAVVRQYAKDVLKRLGNH